MAALTWPTAPEEIWTAVSRHVEYLGALYSIRVSNPFIRHNIDNSLVISDQATMHTWEYPTSTSWVVGHWV
ncbi:hypothetical protein VSDG_01486 [Cytospora chrysosperma]|uniref:Uncharacterized protein n=1 Tax=Cytospora chrysosperma TaxID=252740 RepID=A0A423WJK4_CYTCH|nr:hypothetical protein VSDG_01486 [Valsa sordida]